MSSTVIQPFLFETSLMGLSRMGCSHSFRTPGPVARSFLHPQLPGSARGRWGDLFLFHPTAHNCLATHEVIYTRALKLFLSWPVLRPHPSAFVSLISQASTPEFGEGNGTPLQYSCLEIPWAEEPGRLQSIVLQIVRHD